jgi:hypothetical protein
VEISTILNGLKFFKWEKTMEQESVDQILTELLECEQKVKFEDERLGIQFTREILPGIASHMQRCGRHCSEADDIMAATVRTMGTLYGIVESELYDSMARQGNVMTRAGQAKARLAALELLSVMLMKPFADNVRLMADFYKPGSKHKPDSK